jgi:hypothetical protein
MRELGWVLRKFWDLCASWTWGCAIFELGAGLLEIPYKKGLNRLQPLRFKPILFNFDFIIPSGDPQFL